MHAQQRLTFVFLAGWMLLLAGCRQETKPRANPTAPPTSASSKPLFTDVTDQTGIAFQFSNGRDAGEFAILESLGGGVGVFDYDRDGNVDLMFAGGGQLEDKKVVGTTCSLFRNLGDLKFTSTTNIADVRASAYYNHGVFPADFDNDGFADIAVSGYGGVQLYHNQGDGTFVELTAWTSAPDTSWSTSIAWGDFNGDGNLDMYVPHYVTWSWSEHPRCLANAEGDREVCAPKDFNGLNDTLFLSDGAGQFLDATTPSKLTTGGKGLGAIAVDFDLDGDTDLYVANDTTDNFYYVNDGASTFEEAAVLSGNSGDGDGVNTGSMGIAVGDANNDGLPDIWVTNFERELFALYRNEGASSFTHVSQPAGLAVLGGLYVGFGTVMVDVDHDADQDLVVANGHVSYQSQHSEYLQDSLLLENLGEAKYERVAASDYFAEKHSGRGLANADLNNDGAWDLIFCNSEEPAAILSGRVPAHDRWAMVALVGVVSNRDAIGATLELRSSAGRQVFSRVGGGSYLSSCDTRILLVLPAGAKDASVVVTWPSGTRDEFQFPTRKGNVLWHEGSAMKP